MALKVFNDTTIPQTYSTGLYSEKQYNIAKEHVWKIVDTMVHGMTESLRDIKSTEHPVAFALRKKNGELLLAAVVEYFPNEDDPSKPGNWTYSWTFNEEDLPKEGLREVSPYDQQFCNNFWTYSINKYCFGFKTAEFQGDCLTYLVSLILKWLDENAEEGNPEGVGVYIEGVVTFKVVVENGEKIYTCEVDGEVKQRIKDDAAIEV